LKLTADFEQKWNTRIGGFWQLKIWYWQIILAIDKVTLARSNDGKGGWI